MSADVIDLHREIMRRLDEAAVHVRALDVIQHLDRPGCRIIVHGDTGITRTWPRHLAIPAGWYLIGAGIKDTPCAA